MANGKITYKLFALIQNDENNYHKRVGLQSKDYTYETGIQI